MGTFLTTPKMEPALRARVESSLGRRPKGPFAPVFAPRLEVGFFRLGLIVAIAVVTCSLAIVRHREGQKVERERASLLGAVGALGASLTATEKGALSRTESWLLRSSGSYEGDLVAPELRAPGAIGATLARPAVYVRGPILAFASSVGIAEAASTSIKDSFLLCLVDPPASRTEKAVLGRVRATYFAGALVDERTANIRRFHEAEVGLPVLLPPWAGRVQAAEDLRELGRLRRQLEETPVEEAKRAARAELLIFAMDEPAEGGPTDLDGERAHAVRAGLVDLSSGKVLLRLRRRVDPAWMSPATRAVYATVLDGCVLALDVHESMGG